MDGRSVADMMCRATQRLYDYIDDMQFADPEEPLGVSEVSVISSTVKDDYAILQLESRLNDPNGIMLRVGSVILSEEEALFSRYDEISRTIMSRPGKDVLDLISEGADVSVLSDLRFLIRSIWDFYRVYGRSIGPPFLMPGHVDPIFPDDGTPSDQQRSAAYGVMDSPMSYVWGAPGTGKTQFVLASCIRGCLDAGERVAVFAPTNNAAEQVLRGILKTFPQGRVPEGIVRLGVPTRQFLREHPEMCEDRQAQRRLDDCIRSIVNMEEVLFERLCDRAKESIAYLRGRLRVIDPDALTETEAKHLEFLGMLCSLRPELEGATTVYEGDFRMMLNRVENLFFDRPRPVTSIDEYTTWTEADIRTEIDKLRDEEKGLRARTTGNRIANAPIVVGTPLQFISRFRPRGTEEDSRMELDVDRIFLDEAGYCGLVQALALFSNGVPVIMLGDHMQLPPVSELDDGVIRDNVERGGTLNGTHVWNMSALYVEMVLKGEQTGLRSAYLNNEPPLFEDTRRFDLTESHRFASNLASILDRYVYGNGMSGDDGADLEILILDATCETRVKRENTGEAKAIREYLSGESPDPGNVCILTPYRGQLQLLRSVVPRRYRDSVMTVHASQGREWETVILSVADNRIESRTVPYRFTSSATMMGRRVINTAVSRAKRRLVVVCDREFWSSRDDELIRGLIENSSPHGCVGS